MCRKTVQRISSIARGRTNGRTEKYFKVKSDVDLGGSWKYYTKLGRALQINSLLDASIFGAAKLLLRTIFICSVSGY